ncbi:MAG: hypothetical protein WCW31_04940 [Patescibacteria group bacterium]
MNAQESRVSYNEATSIKVGRLLIAKGFCPASCIGESLVTLDHSDSVGILYKDPELKTRSFFFGLIKKEPRRVFIGTIWFSNALRNADENNWVFEVQGRKYVEMLKRLAEEIASVCNVKIDLRLTQEQPEVEHFFSDISGD